MQRFSFSERTALTSESNEINIWNPCQSARSNGKVFRNRRGAAILCSDGGYWWKKNKKEAEYCFYAQYWLGEFPYGSWSWSVRQCKVTGEVKIEVIDTDINPRGLSSSDQWENECKTYVPDSIIEGKRAKSVV